METDRTQTIGNPDCVRFKDPQSSDLLCISYYEKIRDDAEEFRGGITLFSLDSETNKLNPLSSRSRTAIFDFVWAGESVITANVDYSLSKFSLKDLTLTEESEVAKLEFKPISLCLTGDELFVSGSEGHVAAVDSLTGETKWSKSLFSDNTWCVDYSPESSLIISGSDDSYMCSIDSRTGEKVTKLRPFRKDGDFGITSTNFNLQNPNEVLVGSFGKHLALFDIRNLRESVVETKTQGGVWRIIQRNKALYLPLCFANCYQIFELSAKDSEREFKELETFQGGHQSLVYAMDANEKGKIVSASFYDRVIEVRDGIHSSKPN